MISRDLLQGFIDGYVTAGGDPAQLKSSVSQYLTANPTYPTSVKDQTIILNDLTSYRVTPQSTLAPIPVAVISTTLKVTPPANG
jgi:hypothetical protein